jgi:hypothetical protein
MQPVNIQEDVAMYDVNAMCNLDHVICNFLCHCVIYVNIMSYWIM